MGSLRILVADDEALISSSLAKMLQSMGHTVVAQATGGTEAVEKAERLRPDLAFMDIKMKDMDGFEASKLILERSPLPIVILSAFSDTEFIEKADAIGVSGYLVKPFSSHDLRPALILARSRFKQLQELKQEVVDLKEMIRARKLIERAKGLLMEKEGIAESEAFMRIHRMSRNKNIPMVKIAESIITTGQVVNCKRK